MAAPVGCVASEEAVGCAVIDAAGPVPGTELRVEAAGGPAAAGTSAGAAVLTGADDELASDEEDSPADAGAAMISAPTPVDGASLPAPDVAPSTTGPSESVAVSLAPGFCAVTVNVGPAAPCFRTCVAETRSSGGFRFGSPERAASMTSGRDSSMPMGNFAKRASQVMLFIQLLFLHPRESLRIGLRNRHAEGLEVILGERGLAGQWVVLTIRE